MYKKLVELQSQLQTDKEQLETDVKALQAISDESGSVQFNELAAASRITTAKSKDHLEGTNTAENIIKEVEEEREKANQNLKSLAKQKAEAKQQLSQKQAELASVDREINVINHKIKILVDAEAKQRLEIKVKEYRQSAAKLLNLLIEIDALNAVFTENPSASPVRYVLGLESLPALGSDSLEDIEPWQIESSGEKLFFTRENAFAMVRERLSTIYEEIKGNLHGK